MDNYLAEKMIDPYYFIDRDLQLGFNINLDSHNFSHANSTLTITPKFPEYVIGFRYIKKS